MQRGWKGYKRWVIRAFFPLALLVGCGPGNPPVGSINNAETAINRAQESNAGAYAPLDLKLAQEKLNQARAAVNKENYTKAKRLADEAMVDAELAEAKARSGREKRLADEMQENIDALRQEANRKEGLQR